MDQIICNVCRQPITDPAEQVDRIYCHRSGKELPPQKKHDVCDVKYADEKIALIKVG